MTVERRKTLVVSKFLVQTNYIFIYQNSQGMIAEAIPNWLAFYVGKINSISGLFDEKHKANHVLVNEYCPGNGIMPHLDGPLFHPIISTISLGSSTNLDFYNQIEANETNKSTQLNDRYLFSIYLKPRSLLVLSDRMYDEVCLNS